VHRFVPVLLVFAVLCCFSPANFAQEPPHQARPELAIFGGYSGYRPGGKIDGTSLPDSTAGWAGQVMAYTSRWTALVIDVSGHYGGSATAHDFAAGVRFQHNWGRFVPFGEGLIGAQHFSPKGLPSQNTPTYALGAGLDVKVTPKWSVRPFQLSYINTYYDTTYLSTNGGKNYFNGYRVQAGVVYNFSLPEPQGPVDATCAAEPAAIDSGEPVKVNVVAHGFLPKRRLAYSYVATGGTVTGSQNTASLDTTGVDSGTYRITATVADNGKGKHHRSASCTADFEVKAKVPPTLSVYANPSSVNLGETSTISTKGRSHDDRPLTYSCSSDRGKLSGEGQTYTLDTAGVSADKITVNCTVKDDRGLSASASGEVSVIATKNEVPPAKKFGAIEFSRDTLRPTRVDNQAKGELDRYADALAAAPDSKGILVGQMASGEAQNAAALRAVNTKDYLSKDKGLDPKRIETRTGNGNTKAVELWIVAPGTNFPSEGTATVDETKVKAIPRVVLPAKHHLKTKKHRKK